MKLAKLQHGTSYEHYFMGDAKVRPALFFFHKPIRRTICHTMLFDKFYSMETMV